MIPIAKKGYMAMKTLKLILSVSLVFIFCQSFAQSFTGATDVCPNTNYTYTYADDVTYTTSSWTYTGGATYVSGTGLSRVVKFTSDGTITVQLLNGSSVVSQGTKSVTVNYAGTISGPSQVCTTSNSVTITKSGQVGPFLWQVSTDGTVWTDLGNASSLTHSPAVNSQYRLRMTACSKSPYSNIVSVTVNPSTQAGNLIVSSTNVFCGSGTVLLAFSSNPVGTIQWEWRSKDGVGGTWTSWSVFSTGDIPSNSYNVTGNATLDRFYEYRCTVQSGACSAITGNTVSVTVNPPASVGNISVAQGTTFYGSSGALNLSVSSSQGSVTYEYSDDGSNWFSSSNPTSSFSQSRQFRAKALSGVCAAVYSAPVTVNVFPSPVITINGPDAIPIGVTTNLSVQSSFSTYQWVKNNIDISGATTSTYTVTEPADYKVKVKGSPSSPEATALPVTIGSSLLSQPQAINYKVVTNIYKKAITTSSNFYTLLPNEVKQSIAYMDGYGRTVQNVAVGLSPSRKDIVQPYLYQDVTADQFSYLGYAATTVDGRYKQYAVKNSSLNYVGSNQHAFYQAGGLIAADGSPYSKSIIEASNLERIKEQGAPGADWQPGTTHTVRQNLGVNHSAFTDAALKNVRRWTTAGPVGTNYADNQLSAVTTTDENGNKVWSFMDKLARTVLKRVQLDETVESVVTPFLDTYYVYDDRGNLAIQIPPKAVAKMNGGTAWSNAFRDEWCFVYTYDERNRLVEKKTPDAAIIYYVYDPLDRLVLTQDGFLRPLNKWMFIKYDIKGRPVMSGLYLNTTQILRSDVQTLVVDPLYASGVWYEERGTTLHGYTNLSFPTTNSNATALEVMSVNYYDNYDFDTNGTADFSYTAQSLPGEETQFRSFGLPTGSKRLILGTTTWLYNYVFYDKYGHAIQVRSNNHLSATIDNLSTYVYHFDGTLTYAKTTHKGAAATTVTTLQRMEYDHAGRISKLFQSINGGSEVQVATYSYNELGQLIDKKLHSTDGTNFLQSIDYRYTIRGWLKSINNAQLNVNAANNDDTNDYFGMEFLYNTIEGGLNNQAGDKQYWNGNISAIKWKGFSSGTGTDGQRSYKYDYDKSDKLKKATFQAYKTTDWTKEAGSLNEILAYDANGNIKTLQRNRNLRGLSGTTITSAAETIDNLTYTYASGTGNRLTKVEDAIAGTTGQAGFNNGANVTTEYTYDPNGSILTDQNKGVSAITYNVLGKAAVINFSDGRKIEYTYDATGNKLTMKTYQGVTLLSTTDYAGSYVYENSVLSFFGSPEGRVVKKASVYEYEYSISDHQGNTRVVFTSVTPAAVAPVSTLEGDANDGSSQYTNIVPGNVVSFTAANHTAGGIKVVRMNQTYKIGPSKSVKVYPGDQIDMEVWEYHEGNSGFGTTSTPLTTLVTMVSGAFGGVSGGVGDPGLIYNGVNSALNGFLPSGNQGSARPAAYLNYILFDKDYKVLDMGWQLAPATTFTKQKLSFPTLQIKEAGYVFVYLSYDNDSNNWVYFDDMKVTHTKGNILQYNEYYPFGLQTNSSWTREGNKNDFLYNAGNELNATSGWYETFFRGYDATLGKFLQTDPKADKYGSWSPYNYGFNDPVYWNDPYGDDGNSLEENKKFVSDSRKEDQDASAGMYGAGWNYQTYGSPSGVGGSAFARYGPGDGGALQGLSAYTVANSHAAKALASGGVAGVNSEGQLGYFLKSYSVVHNGEGSILDELVYSEEFVPAGIAYGPLQFPLTMWVDPNSLKLKKIAYSWYGSAHIFEEISVIKKNGIAYVTLNATVNFDFKAMSNKAIAQYLVATAMDRARAAVWHELDRNPGLNAWNAAKDFKEYFGIYLMELTMSSEVKTHNFQNVPLFEVQFRWFPSLPPGPY